MFHHILVAADGSAHAQRALNEAIDIAQTEGARLTILTAVPHPIAAAAFAGGAALSLADELEVEFKAILDQAAEAVPDDLPVETVLTHRPSREALIEQVDTGTFDLLVMGSRGRGAVKSALLGSVSHHVVNHSSIPVLVVPVDAP